MAAACMWRMRSHQDASTLCSERLLSDRTATSTILVSYVIGDGDPWTCGEMSLLHDHGSVIIPNTPAPPFDRSHAQRPSFSIHTARRHQYSTAEGAIPMRPIRTATHCFGRVAGTSYASSWLGSQAMVTPEWQTVVTREDSSSINPRFLHFTTPSAVYHSAKWPVSNLTHDVRKASFPLPSPFTQRNWPVGEETDLHQSSPNLDEELNIISASTSEH